MFTGAVSAHHQSPWVCHLAQLPLLCGSRLTPDPGLLVGLRRAAAGGLRSRGAGGVSLSLRLARAQSPRHPRRRILRHTFCVDPGLAGALNAAGIFSALSPQANGASGSTALSSAAVVALRTREDGVETPSFPVRSTVNLFPHWCNGNYGEVWLCAGGALQYHDARPRGAIARVSRARPSPQGTVAIGERVAHI